MIDEYKVFKYTLLLVHNGYLGTNALRTPVTTQTDQPHGEDLFSEYLYTCNTCMGFVVLN